MCAGSFKGAVLSRQGVWAPARLRSLKSKQARKRSEYKNISTLGAKDLFAADCVVQESEEMS